MRQHWLPVAVSPGQFPNEYAVGGTQHNGKAFSLFAPKATVEVPQSGSDAGFLRVAEVDRKGDLVLVRLPAQTLENGQYITVKASDLKPIAAPEKVAP